jgi:phage terminase large subunit
VKQYWLDRVYPSQLASLADRFYFVPALPDDNPYLDAGYWSTLETLPPALARAWRWGDWDIFEGQVFGQFRRDKHVVQPFEIPSAWKKWGGLDWGFAKPFSFHVLAKDPDTGRVYVIGEIYQEGLTDRAQARRIGDMFPGLRAIYADPSMWTKKNMEDKTFSSADEYRAEGVYLVQADNNRMIGKRKLDVLLEDMSDGKPGLQIFETCPNLIRTLPALPYDTVRVEDVNTDAEDHAYDSVRYALTATNPRPVVKPRLEEIPIDDPLTRRGIRLVRDEKTGEVRMATNPVYMRSRDL